MKKQLENMCTEKKELSENVMKLTLEMERRKGSHPARQMAPYLDHRHLTYSGETRQILPSEDRRRKLFSEVVKDDSGKQ